MLEQRKSIRFDSSKIVAAIQKAYELEHPEEFQEPPDELFEILDYLPELYADDSEQKYIEALKLAMQTSYKNGLYQFAYVQYHMLFMTVVYFVLLKVSLLHKEEFEKALYYLLKDRYRDFFKDENTKHGQLYFGSFAQIGENDVFMLLRVVGMDPDLWGQLKGFVKERNRYAHANGQLQLTSEEYFLEKVQAFNSKSKQIFSLIENYILALYANTLCDPDFYDPDIRSYLDADQQIQEEFIRKYSLSRVELNWCRKYNINQYENLPGYVHIKELHVALAQYYTELIDHEA